MSGAGERKEPVFEAPPATGQEDGGTTTALVEGGATTTAAAPAQEDWREKRIGQLSARLHERNDVISQREARIAELERDIAASRAASPATGAATTAVATGGLTEEEVERRAETRAREIAAQTTAQADFNRQCNEAVATGRSQFADFDAKLGSLRGMVTPGDRASEEAYWGIVSAALKTGDASKIIYKLGADQAEAMRLLSLDPESRAIEVAKIAMAKGASDDDGEGELPKPITPVGSKGSQHTSISPDDKDRADRLSTAEWMKRRAKQVDSTHAEARSR